MNVGFHTTPGEVTQGESKGGFISAPARVHPSTVVQVTDDERNRGIIYHTLINIQLVE